MNSEAVLGVWGYEITSIEHSAGAVRIQARYSGAVACPDCSGEQLRSKGRYLRRVRHESWGMRHCFLILEARKWFAGPAGGDFASSFQAF